MTSYNRASQDESIERDKTNHWRLEQLSFQPRANVTSVVSKSTCIKIYVLSLYKFLTSTQNVEFSFIVSLPTLATLIRDVFHNLKRYNRTLYLTHIHIFVYFSRHFQYIPATLVQLKNRSLTIQREFPHFESSAIRVERSNSLS